MGINKELLEILACPKCKGEVKLTQEGDGLYELLCLTQLSVYENVSHAFILTDRW